MNIPDLRVDRDYASDNIVLTNTKRAQRTVVSRMEIENSNLPYSVIASAIETIMPNTTPVTAVNTGAIGASSGGGSGFGAIIKSAMQISSGGSGGIQHIVNGGGRAIGATGMPYYLDDPHEIDLKTKLFSYAEQMLIADVKNSIRKHFIENVDVTKFNMEKIVVAGGCFASMLNREPVNDYDVFILDDDSNRSTVESISVSPRSGDVRVGDSNYMQNDKIEKTVFVKNSRIQYINTKYKTREELIKHFDFKHCCVSYDPLNDKLFITREVYDLIKAKKLVHNSDKPPALWRYEKFHGRGWKSDPVIVAA